MTSEETMIAMYNSGQINIAKTKAALQMGLIPEEFKKAMEAVIALDKETKAAARKAKEKQ